MVSVDVKHHVYLLCPVARQEGDRSGGLDHPDEAADLPVAGAVQAQEGLPAGSAGWVPGQQGSEERHQAQRGAAPHHPLHR